MKDLETSLRGRARGRASSAKKFADARYCAVVCPHFQCVRRGSDTLTLRPKFQSVLNNAEGYFRGHLAVGDYCMGAHVVTGEWRGVGAAKFGLHGPVPRTVFIELYDWLNPEIGRRSAILMVLPKTLNPQQKGIHV